MNSRINLLKENLKTHLSKRINLDEGDISFFSIPYSLNIVGEGIEGLLSDLISICTNKIYLIGFIKNVSKEIKIYDCNKSDVYIISPTGKNNTTDEYSAIINGAVNCIKNYKNLDYGIIAVTHDDFSASSISSPSMKFATFIYTLCKANNLNLDYNLFISLFDDMNRNHLSINFNTNEVLSFINNAGQTTTKQSKKFNSSLFKDIRVLQISFKEKRLRTQIETNFLSNLKRSYSLLKVLMASARKKNITNFSLDEIKNFSRRFNQENQKMIEYIYKESRLIEELILCLESNDIESFFNIINKSNSNLFQLDIINEQISGLLDELKCSDKILASKIIIRNNSFCAFVESEFEKDITTKIRRKVENKLQKIFIDSSEITDIYIYN